MTGLVRKATLLTVCGLVIAGAAMANTPSPANSQKPCIMLMDFPNSNNNAGANPALCADPLYDALHVIVRDGSNIAVQGAEVILDFSTCSPAANFKLADTQSDPAVTTICGGKTVRKLADNAGHVCFTVEGGTDFVQLSSAVSPSPYDGLTVRNIGPSAGAVCCAIRANTILLGSVLTIVNKYDLDGTAGAGIEINANDRSYVLDAEGFYSSNTATRYRTFPDYDCDGDNDAGDRSLMLDAEGNDPAENVYVGTYCP